MRDVRLEHAAMALADDERAELALKLLCSLPAPGAPVASEDEWRAAWVPEIEQRMLAMRAGSEPTFDADEVLIELRADLTSARRAP
jgi:hypothetical protein